MGVVHGDICPENMVIDGHDNLRVIDNDSIAQRAREFDLARLWYRWPMTIDQREAFDDGYGLSDVLACYREHFLHWAIVVLVGAADFRSRYELSDASVPLRRLREILVRQRRPDEA